MERVYSRGAYKLAEMCHIQKYLPELFFSRHHSKYKVFINVCDWDLFEGRGILTSQGAGFINNLKS